MFIPLLNRAKTLFYSIVKIYLSPQSPSLPLVDEPHGVVRPYVFLIDGRSPWQGQRRKRAEDLQELRHHDLEDYLTGKQFYIDYPLWLLAERNNSGWRRAIFRAPNPPMENPPIPVCGGGRSLPFREDLLRRYSTNSRI